MMRMMLLFCLCCFREANPSSAMTGSDGKRLHERRLCGIRIAQVCSVQHQKWPLKRHKAFFNLLAVSLMDMAEQVGKESILQFEFSGGSSLRVKIDKINIALEDLAAGYPTSLQPGHKF